MKKILMTLFVALTTLGVQAQTLDVNMSGVTYRFNAADCGDMTYGSSGTTLTINGKTFTVSNNSITIDTDGTPMDDHCVEVTYNGTSAKVVASGDLMDSLTVSVDNAKVNITQNDAVAEEITYTLSGTSTDGQFYMTGSYKATVELNGLTLTNTTGAPVYINDGKRIDFSVKKGTENTLKDTSASTDKGCLYCKGHLEMKGKGTLNIYAYGSKAHGINAGEYFEMKNCMVNILAATKDGVNCNEYFLMESGTLKISGTGDDGIQVSLDGETSTGETIDHEDEDTGNFYMIDGTIIVDVTATAAKGIKADGSITVTAGTITATTSGNGEWDSDELKTKASSCMSADGDMTVNGGTLTLTSTGAGGKGLNVDGLLTVNDGTITVNTSGNACVYTGSAINNNYTGNLDRYDSDYKSVAKGIKAGTKTLKSAYSSSTLSNNQKTNPNYYDFTGGLVITGGTVHVKTSGNGAEGIESKSDISISGGEVAVVAYDDAINSGNDFTVSGGTVLAYATNNDGMDSNGNMTISGGTVYAIGASSPEVAIDANSEAQKKLTFSGGNLVAVGGLESGSTLSQACKATSSWSSNTWYGLYSNGTLVFAFKTPNASRNSQMVVSTSGTTTLFPLSISGGTNYLLDYANTGGSYTKGTQISLTSYSGGNSGGGPGGGGGPWGW